VIVQPFESTASNRDNWSGYWPVCAESARENSAQQMHYKLLLAARSRCCLMSAVAKETFWQRSFRQEACDDASDSNPVRSG